MTTKDDAVEPALQALADAPLDDEPIDADEERAVAEAREEVRRGEVVPHSKVERLSHIVTTLRRMADRANTGRGISYASSWQNGARAATILRDAASLIEGILGFIEKVTLKGGAIVPTETMTPMQIAAARAADRVFVSPGGYGFAHVPAPDCRSYPLPDVHLSVSGDVFEARSPEGYDPPWRIRAEAETEVSARTTIRLDDRLIADVTIHAAHTSRLPDEVQAVSAALLWSALRATRLAAADGNRAQQQARDGELQS